MPKVIAAVLSVAFVSIAAADSVRVAAAISLKDAITQVADAYTTETGEKVEFTFGSSGQMMGQIKAGAPIDAFLSAANKQVDELIQAGLVDETTRRVIATNGLVLIVPADSKLNITGFQSLTEASITRIAAGEPQTVPAGQYADQMFNALGLTDSIRSKLVYGTNVRQVLGYVERGEVAAGIVYKTDALESEDKVKVVAVAPADTHEPIVYPAIVVNASTRKDAAIRFLDYLTGDNAQAILRAKGFIELHEHGAVTSTTVSQSLRIMGNVPAPLTMTPEQWALLTRDSVKAQDHNSQEHTYDGVLLANVLEAAGLKLTSAELRGGGLTRYLLVEAADGYRVVFALPELSSDFTDRRVLLADRRDGEALSDHHGPLQLIVPDEQRHARWVRQVISLTIVDAAEHVAE